MAIKNCADCGSKPHQQDAIHGSGRRVFNEHRSKTAKIARCTVCGRSETTHLTNEDKKS